MKMLCVFLMVISCVGLAWGEDDPNDAVTAPTQAEASASESAQAKELVDVGEYWVGEGVMSPPDADPKQALSLTADKSVEMALENNAKGKVAQDDVDAAKARIGQARSALLPQIRATEVYTRSEESDTAGGLFDALIGDITPSDTRRDSIGLTQTLFAGGQIVAAVKASKFLAESQEWQRQATLNQLAYDARQAYYDCLLAHAIMRVAEESVVTFERHLADTQQMFDVGLVSNFEVLRAKTEVGSRQSDLVAATNALKLALVNLRRILAIPQDTPIHLEPELSGEVITAAVDEFLANAELNRPELLALDKAIRASEQNVRQSKGEYLPRASANIAWSNTDGGSAFAQDGWTFTIGGEWDLFAGGRRIYTVREARANERSLTHQREDLARLVEMDVRQAYIQMQDALARVEEEKGTVELADEGRRLAELRFQEGVGTQVEVLDAELALTNAQSSLVRALRNYVVAIAALDRAVGVSHVAKPDVSKACAE